MDTISADTLRIGFIGAGRLGQAMAWTLAQHGCTIHAAASRSARSAQALAAPLPACKVLSPQQVANECDLVFVTTPDASIKATVDQIQWRAGMGVAHCSGATEVSALSTAADQGALTGGFHPMQTFSDPQVAVRTLPGCVVTIEAQGRLETVLRTLAGQLGCTVNALPPGMRGRYHAAGAYGSQFANVLLAEAARIWQSWGASEEDALRALLPLLKGTISSIESIGLAKGMPGPVSRGDTGTVARHVQALSSVDADVAALYRELCRRSVPLAQSAERIDAKTADDILRTLD
ncbi:Rossmann-like and DUF2520 domain-containing protein [Allopusillimonas ginsengisoli]|uniref:Rossmann-like and DUF2520 domain-containing protein n=1 Tax=Allopusillimonas ginsengisoli TaxID=453575 RepID=UPI00143023C2|nr:DUF2520 domain-containing protein [Allopusillimonas ginsengisoli]